MTTRPEWIDRLEPRFAAVFGSRPEPWFAVAPGRVNLIGEHTDYNDGWVLPMAIDRRVGVTIARRADRRLRAHSVVFDETREIDIDTLTPPGGADWFSYVAGAAWALETAGHRVSGADLVIDGDVPLGSGLSSSSALEMAVILALCRLGGIEWSPVEMALLGQKAESGYVGVEGGIMDQFAATMGREDHALLLDCRSLETTPVPLPNTATIVVMDTGAPRTLATSAYNDRSRNCRRAVAALQEADSRIRALRDVTPEFLAAHRGLMDQTTYRRARHVVEETHRPSAMADALADPDLSHAGRLMDQSHASLRDLYEVSSRELDLFTELARAHPACFGARLTGAGFGGCAIALVATDGCPDFIEEVHTGYRRVVDRPSSVFACRPAAGARIYDAS